MDDGHLTTQELIAQLEAKDRHFRAASILFGLLLIGAVIALLFVGLSTLQGVRSQLTAQKRLLDSQQQILSKIQASSKQSAIQTQDLQNHIDCIVELFQHPNHNSLTIGQLQGCQLSAAPSGSSTNSGGGGSNAPRNNTGSAPASASTAQPKAASVAPAPQQTTLESLPVVGRLFKAVGL